MNETIIIFELKGSSKNLECKDMDSTKLERKNLYGPVFFGPVLPWLDIFCPDLDCPSI